VPLAYFVLKEPVGPARIGAAVVGFLGVLLMTGVATGGGGEAFGLPHMTALGAAFLFALTVTGLKTITPDHTPLQILVWSASLGLIFSLPPAMFSWAWPSLPDFLLLSLMGVIGIFTQYCYTRGMQVGDAGAMAPMDYIRLVFAALAGFLLFQELPMMHTLAGAAVVVGSTLFITWREHVVARRKVEHPLD
jgi:drug/metabolite transporter (DMT)-like permease